MKREIERGRKETGGGEADEPGPEELKKKKRRTDMEAL